MSTQLRTLFMQVRALFKLHEARFVLIEDTPVRYRLASPAIGRSTPFGGVELAKAQVLAELPVRLHPELKDDLSPALRRRLKRGSRFAFTELDDDLTEDVAALIARSVTLFEREGRLTG